MSMTRVLRHTRGATFIEYLLLVGIVALGMIFGFREARRRQDRVIAREAFIVKTFDFVTQQQFDGFDPGAADGPRRIHLPIVNGGRPTANGCFARGTPVATAEGPRAIETVLEGDMLWSRDEATGAIDLRPVLKRYATPHQRVMDLGIAALDGGEMLRPTPGHPFWVTGQGWVSAENLSIHGELWSPSGAPLHLALPNAPTFTYETVYNFEVAEYHTYFVGRHGVWVHNGPPQTGPPSARAGTPPPPGQPGQPWCQGQLGPLPPNSIASMKALGLPLGGSYREVRDKATAQQMGGEVNHIPPWQALRDTGYGQIFSRDSAPTIWMEKEDHRELNSTVNEAYRKLQALYIAQGKFCWAVAMDLAEIRGRWPDKYEEGIQEMLKYLKSKGIDCTG
jgi:hypothetical protein